MRHQRTLAKSSFFSGIGLHSGHPTSLAIHPAPPNTGVIFVKHVDEAFQLCPATISCLGHTDHCTTIQTTDFQVQTVEHVLSALAGLEIDNAYVELQGREIPAADGSAAPFVDLLLHNGMVAQEEERTYLKIVQPICVEEEHRSLTVLPAALPQITYCIDFPHPLIQQQEYRHACTSHEFTKHIAGARTFAFKEEVEFLWSRGLGLGGSLDNTIVFSEKGLLNEEGLRFPNECVRHKILDLIGDLSLLGIPVIGHFIARCAGHSLHTKLIRAILDNPHSWITLNSGTMEKDQILHQKSFPTSARYLPELQPAFQSL